MTFNLNFVYFYKIRPAFCTVSISFNNLFTSGFFFWLVIVFSKTVQHVAVAEIFFDQTSYNPDTFKFTNKFYSTETASSKEKLISEIHLESLLKNYPIINTTNGLILGKTVTANIRPTDENDHSFNPKLSKVEKYKVNAFFGIPYANPPIGTKRFQLPEELNRTWHGYIFNATKKADSCIQLNDTFFGDFYGSTMWNANTPLSEDCLTLNIWIPQEPKQKLLPIMVWIYGGAFYSGTTSIDIYDGSIFSARGNVIFISINYRGASLGFLYLNRTDAPGNVGLLDQLVALKWINKNAKKFGGDPNSVTLFGESAGAASINYLLLSSHSNGLYNRAILQSGSATSPWAITSHEIAIYRSLRLAENVGCINATMKFEKNEHNKIVEIQDMRRYTNYEFQKDDNLINCLQKIDPLELLKNEFVNTSITEFAYVPVIDNFILPDSPANLLKKQNFNATPILLGSVTNEANYFLVYHLSEILKKTEKVNVSRNQLRSIISNYFKNEDELVIDAIIHQYTYWNNPNDEKRNLELVDKLFGDLRFSCPMNEIAKSYAEINSTVYQYVFTHRSSLNPWPKWMGILHADEINFIIGEPLNTAFNYTNAEIRLSERMLAFWVNFARTGNPMESDVDFPQLKYPIKNDKWPAFTKNNNVYKLLNTNFNKSLGYGPPRSDQCAFWLEYLPNLKIKLKKRFSCNSATFTFLKLNTKILITLTYLLIQLRIKSVRESI